jgi:Tfp pilus assembly protein PilE
MGQQQLLLIVLGVIVVGIAVVVGISLFTANAVSSNRDGVVADLTNLGTMAQQYYKKPTAMGGGGNSFTDWTIPTHTDTTPNGVYLATISDQSITLVGTGNELNAGSPIQHTATITPGAISVTMNN